MNKAKIGVAGTPPNFNGKSSEFFQWLKGRNLNAYEVQCTMGFKISDAKIKYYSDNANKYGIALSIHAPYYVNLGSQREEVVQSSIASMINGIKLAQRFNCTRIIFHPGGGWGKTLEDRQSAIHRIIQAIHIIEQEVDMGDVRLYPEIGGKISTLGTLDEIIQICNECESCYPCIDIAHLHARTLGSLKSKNDLENVFIKLKNNLPAEKFQNIHFHAYTILYGDKGEIRHLVHDEKYPDGAEGEPNLTDFISLVKKYNVNTWIVSEARDSQDMGAIFMRKEYDKYE